MAVVTWRRPLDPETTAAIEPEITETAIDRMAHQPEFGIEAAIAARSRRRSGMMRMSSRPTRSPVPTMGLLGQSVPGSHDDQHRHKAGRNTSGQISEAFHVRSRLAFPEPETDGCGKSVAAGGKFFLKPKSSAVIM